MALLVAHASAPTGSGVGATGESARAASALTADATAPAVA